MRVGLFVTCLADLMRPSVAFAAVKLLEDAGCRVEVPAAQTCCGQPALNSGDSTDARDIARRVIQAFEGFDAVVGPSGSCMGTLRQDYPALFAGEPAWAARAEDLARRSHELLSFLVDVLEVEGVDTRYDGQVTYHDSCAGLREMGVKGQPRKLLASVQGLDLVEMRGTDECCGFGGTFCVKYPEISTKMVDDKIAHIQASGAGTVLGGDLGCLLNIAGRIKRRGLPIRVLHTAELLAGMGAQPSIGEPQAEVMHAPTTTFPERVSIAIVDKRLQAALDHASGGFVQKRATLVAALPEFEALRDRARDLKNHVLAHLDTYLERYEEQVQRHGGQVHWAATAEEAREIILEICRKANAKTITKGKSMVSEEIGLNDALEAAGYHVVETDLGEYIIQLAKEPPSHIIVPAVHKTRAQVADLFDEHHRPLGYTKHLTEVSEMVNEARQVLREHYFKADVGITGGNFLIAETGSSLIVTNEGNGDLTQTLARVHIVTSGIERVVPTFDDALTFLRLLARSATGQETETYTTVSTGPRRADDLDGPQEYHVVLVDNGRSKMLGGPFREMLRCIRCGACLNHCPVYTSIGGHAYGWVYPGPMGSVLTPLINGIDQAYDLPNACTLNGRCQTVCPVKIPLPGLLREIRRQQFESGLTPAPIRWALQAWAALAKHAGLYHLAMRVAIPALSLFGRKRGALGWLPLAGGWTDTRDLPAPQGGTFQQAWRARRGARQ